jgi:hypothetical protein
MKHQECIWEIHVTQLNGLNLVRSSVISLREYDYHKNNSEILHTGH